MGKAANRYDAKRVRYLKTLAKSPDQFEIEWEKRLNSWVKEIRRNAGRLKSKDGQQIMAIFQFVDKAMHILQECGEDVYLVYGERTYDLLTGECCKAFSEKAVYQYLRTSSFNNLHKNSIYKSS